MVAGNKLGKDFVAGYIALSFFRAPWMYYPAWYFKQIEQAGQGKPSYLVHTRRVITTSVKDDHLRVLWGEIGRYITTCEIPLVDDKKQGISGSLIVNHHEIRLKEEASAKNPLNYLLGCVSQKGEGLSGHHAAYTLCIVDEASGVENIVYGMAQAWAHKFLIFGNPNPCTQDHFFYQAVRGGDVGNRTE